MSVAPTEFSKNATGPARANNEHGVSLGAERLQAGEEEALPTWCLRHVRNNADSEEIWTDHPMTTKPEKLSSCRDGQAIGLAAKGDFTFGRPPAVICSVTQRAHDCCCRRWSSTDRNAAFGESFQAGARGYIVEFDEQVGHQRLTRPSRRRHTPFGFRLDGTHRPTGPSGSSSPQ